MLNITEQKKELRVRLIKERKAFGEIACFVNSRKIELSVLMSAEFTFARVIHFYLSDQFEVQTGRLIQEALRFGKRVVVPVPSEKQPTLSEIFNFSSNPKFINRVSPEEVDLWVIPTVAYDTMGHRLGRGGGYYDRLLQGRSGKIVCLAFDFQEVENVPVEKTDHHVDMIITESKTIHIGEKKNAVD